MFHRVGRIRVPKADLSRSVLEQRFSRVEHPFGDERIQRVSAYADVTVKERAVMFYIEVDAAADNSNLFKGNYSSRQALKEIKQCGGRPACYEELLGYYGYWMRVQSGGDKECWMRLTVALASYVPFKGKRSVPSLIRNPNFFARPTLRLCHYSGPWPAGTRFLAVR